MKGTDWVALGTVVAAAAAFGLAAAWLTLRNNWKVALDQLSWTRRSEVYLKILAWLEDVIAWDLGKPTSSGFDPNEWRLGPETYAFASDRVKYEIDWVLHILRVKEGIASGMQGNQKAASHAIKARNVIRAELATGRVEPVPLHQDSSSSGGDGGRSSRSWLGDPHLEPPRGRPRLSVLDRIVQRWRS